MSNWSKIKHRYPPNWPQLSHYIRFVRAKGKCERCGVAHGQRYLLTPNHGAVILACAHRNHDTNDNRHSNLIALCQSCHLSHDRTDNQARAQWGRFVARLTRQPQLFVLDLTEKFRR